MNLSVLRNMAREGDASVEALQYLLGCHGECEWLDYKEKILLEKDYGLATFTRDVLAMSNSGGGYIVVGVEDKTWRPVGIGKELPYDTKLLRDKVRRGCGVSPDVDLVHHTIVSGGTPLVFALILVRGQEQGEGGHLPIMVATDFCSDQKYGLARGDIYARRGDSTIKVDDAEILGRLLHRDQTRAGPARPQPYVGPALGGEAGAALVFISQSTATRPADDLQPGDSLSKHQFRKQYLQDLVRDIENRLRENGYDVGGDDVVPPEESREYHSNVGLLTCNYAVILIDRDALTSPHMRRVVSVLMWLRGFGLSVLPVALGDVTRDDILNSPLGELSSLQQMSVLTFPDRKQNAVARATHVSMICEAVANALPRKAANPAVRWVQDMAHFLASVPDGRLPALGEHLGVSPNELARSADPRGVVAAALLGSDVAQVWWCLRDAVAYLDHEAKEAVVTRTAPIWVDLDTARFVLDVTDLPEGQRVCGFETTALRLGDNVVKRATASAPEYTTLRVPDAVGEDAGQELLERYERSLRHALHVSGSDTPESIRRQLADYHAAVFVLVRCTTMNPQVTQNLLTRLGQRFPGIAFILLADPDSPIWRSMPQVRRSPRRWTRDDDLEARRHVSRLYGLVGRDILVDSDD